MVQIALFFAVLQLRGASDLAYLVLAGNVPSLVLGPFLGASMDRWDVGRAARMAGFGQACALLAVAGLLRGPLVALAFAYAGYNVLQSLGAGARQRLLYAAVPATERPRANAAIAAVTGIVAVVGAALGGGVALSGPGPILVAAIVLRVLATIVLAGVRRAHAAQQGTATREPYWQAFRAGLRAIGAFPRATSVLVVGMAWGLIGGGYDVLLSDYGVHLLHGGSAGLGALYMVDGLGVVVGTLVARKVGARLKGHVYGVSYMLQGVFWTLFALSGRFVVAVPLLFLMRLASGVIIAWDTTLLLETVPDGLHGRIYSLHASTYGAVMQISLAVTGVLLALVGARAVAVGAGVGSLLVGLTWWLSVGRHWTADHPALPKADAVARKTRATPRRTRSDRSRDMRAIGA